MNVNRDTLNSALSSVTELLLAERTEAGHWVGELSSSALATATACFALESVDSQKYSPIVNSAAEWLVSTQNEDGGWGDTPCSPSNVPATLLCWAAIKKNGTAHRFPESIERLKRWLTEYAGGCTPGNIVTAVDAMYGNDRTFSVPILTMCNLAGLLGEQKKGWRCIKPLPFELAAVSPKVFNRLRLSVVSYAMPALIAMGQVNFYFRKPLNPLPLFLRLLTRKPTLKLLEKIQPASGGFLEAIPLTGFVLMTLVAAGSRGSDVVKRCAEFLCQTAGKDGSWTIDTNLATWLTTLSVNALPGNAITASDKSKIKTWLLNQQHNEIHPYTNAAPGGWAWTDTSGGVPDADDTPGGLIALKHLGTVDDQTRTAARAAVTWLLALQNRDGGIPTFCKGWNRLPFDMSSPDLTSHSLAAMALWISDFDEPFALQIQASIKRMVNFLLISQKKNGSWLPLWFGNQYTPGQQNPVYGTSRVLLGLSKIDDPLFDHCGPAISKAIGYLLSVQNADGGFGGDKGADSSIEETALAVDSLAAVSKQAKIGVDKHALSAGTNWLINRVQSGAPMPPSPIGLYFAKLWYAEKLYPLIFTASALQRVSELSLTDLHFC